MTATFHVGDAIQVMNTLPEKSVDLVLTSVPFLALRSYLPADHPDKHLEGGSQATPGAYIDWLIDVVEACARILAPHGSLCLELGDTYAGSGGAGGDYADDGLREGQPKFRQSNTLGWPLPKSLSLIPEIFRFTLVYGFNPLTMRITDPWIARTTERWRLRNVIRWVRPNPPVGALGDKFRPATSELMVFCKSAKRFFDLDAVREPHQPHGGNYRSSSKSGKQGYSGFSRDVPYRIENPAGAPPLDWWNIPPGGYQGAHYAVWPPELLIRPIKAMCPEKVCRVCGEPSRRIVGDVHYIGTSGGLEGEDLTEYAISWKSGTSEGIGNNKYSEGGGKRRDGNMSRVAETTGFSDCGHNNWRPGLVLDPFVGSGTTLAVATGHGRDAIGIDLDERNYQLALERVGPLILQRGEVAA